MVSRAQQSNANSFQFVTYQHHTTSLTMSCVQPSAVAGMSGRRRGSWVARDLYGPRCNRQL